MAIVRQGPPNGGVECRCGRHKAKLGSSAIASCRSMTYWTMTCEQQLRQSSVHLRRHISESIFIAACSMHDYDEDRTEQCMQCLIGSTTCGRRIVVKLMTDTKPCAASLRQQSYLFLHHCDQDSPELMG